MNSSAERDPPAEVPCILMVENDSGIAPWLLIVVDEPSSQEKVVLSHDVHIHKSEPLFSRRPEAFIVVFRFLVNSEPMSHIYEPVLKQIHT